MMKVDNSGKLEKTKDPEGFWSHEHFKHSLIFFFFLHKLILM